MGNAMIRWFYLAVLASLAMTGAAHAQNSAPVTICGRLIPNGDLVIVGSASTGTCLADGGSTTPSSIIQEVKITGISANTALSPVLPSNCTLILITAQETSGNSNPGGLSFGTSSGGTDIFAGPATLGANDSDTINSAAMSIQQAGGSTVWVNSTSWGSSVVSAQAYCLEQ